MVWTSFDALKTRGYTNSKNDYSSFCKNTRDLIVFLSVYVNDILMTGTYIEEIQSLKIFLKSQFIIKDLKELHYFLGIEIIRKPDGVLVTQ